MQAVHPDKNGEVIDPKLLSYINRAKKVLCKEETYTEYMNETTKQKTLFKVIGFILPSLVCF